MRHCCNVFQRTILQRTSTTISCVGNSQNYRSRGAVDVRQVVHSTEGAMVLIVAHEGMKIVLRDVGDVSP